MRPAFHRVDVVTEGIDAWNVAIVILHGDFRKNPVLYPFHIHNLFMQRRLVLVQIFHILADTAIVFIFNSFRLRFPFITKHQTNAFVQESQLTNTCIQSIKIIFLCFLKDFRICLETHNGTMLFAVIDDFQRSCCLASVFKTKEKLMSVLMYVNLQPFTQCINNTGTDTMQTSGNLISTTAEFTTGMQYSKNRFHTGYSCLFNDSRRHSSTIILYTDDVIFFNRYFNIRSESGKSLIDRVINNFPDKVMKTSLTGRTDIHTRSFPYSFQSFQDLNIISRIRMINLIFHFFDFFHLILIHSSSS